MKNMRKATGILLTATGLLAAGNSARAQTQVTLAPAGQAYTIISNVPASAVNPVTYQWYRNNNPIAGATSASYTVPGPLAYGDNVQFYRLAKTADCTGDVEKKSNTLTITFTGYIVPEGCTLVIGGMCWASANVDNPNTFATRADMYTQFYQWNKLIAYSANDPLTPAWNGTTNTSETWTVNPCPAGWRLPTHEEYQLLHNAGSTWVVANARGNQVAGRFYGYNNASCQLPNNMNGCIFLPAGGYRDGSLSGETVGGQSTNGFYWSSTEVATSYGYLINFTITSSNPNVSIYGKSYGMNVRCVK